MNCLAGIYKPTQGQAFMQTAGGEIDIFKVPQVSKYFSVVPQHDVVWPNLSLQEHLDLMQMLNSLEHPVKTELLISAL